MSLLPQFDPLLQSVAHRDLIRVMFALVRRCRQGLVVAHGHAASAATFVELLAKNFPETRRLALLAQRNPMRVTTIFTGETPRVETREAGGTTAGLLKSFLRQDPDVVAVTQLDAESAPLAYVAAETGHLVVLGSAAGELESIVAALASTNEGLRPHAEAAVRLVAGFSLDGKLERVAWRLETGELTEVARIENDQLVIQHDTLPKEEEQPPLYTPRWAPPLADRSLPAQGAKTSFAITTAQTDGPHLLGTPYAFRPSGSSWPSCGQCQQPLALIISLDLQELLGEPFRVQLFLCRAGSCDLSSETAAGVVAEQLPSEGLFRLEAPETLKTDVVAPGCLVLHRVEDDPAEPLQCDKIFGWPVGEATPDAVLLFQFVEGVTLEGGKASGWDFTEARLLPGERPSRVIDPNAPRHFDGEGAGFLFRGPEGLTFRWQTD